MSIYKMHGHSFLVYKLIGAPQLYWRILFIDTACHSRWTGKRLQNWMHRCVPYKMMMVSISWNLCHMLRLTREWQEVNKNHAKIQVLEPAFILINHKAKSSSSVNFFLQIKTDGFLGFNHARASCESAGISAMSDRCCTSANESLQVWSQRRWQASWCNVCVLHELFASWRSPEVRKDWD